MEFISHTLPRQAALLLFIILGGGRNYSFEFMSFNGTGKSHLELSIGMTLLENIQGYEHAKGDPGHLGVDVPMSDYRYFLHAGSVGYRYQKPGGFIIFRCRAGFPDLLYVGFGFCF